MADVSDLDAEGKALFLAFPTANAVRAVATTGKRPVAALDTGETPRRVALLGAR